MTQCRQGAFHVDAGNQALLGLVDTRPRSRRPGPDGRPDGTPPGASSSVRLLLPDRPLRESLHDCFERVFEVSRADGDRVGVVRGLVGIDSLGDLADSTQRRLPEE